MLRWILGRALNAFSRQFDYDVTFAREILQADPRALLAINKVSALAHYHRDVPLSAWFAAKIVGTLTEDCGPCTQLGLTMAERAGIPATTLQALVAGDFDALPEDAALAARFAQATLTKDPEADPLRDEIVRRWGPRALISLAFALTAARFYPTIKAAMGHAQSCSRLTIQGQPARIRRESVAS